MACEFCYPSLKRLCELRGCANSNSDSLNLPFESYAEDILHGSTTPETTRFSPPELPKGKTDKGFTGTRWSKNHRATN